MDKRFKPRLSRGLLDMKFMQRSKTKMLADIEADEGREFYDKGLTERMKSGVEKFIIEPSYIPCENLIIGRVSYGGMNKEIEKIMESEQQSKKPKFAKEMDVDVSAQEMADFKSSMYKTMSDKFDTKKQKRKKAKFAKPDE